MYNWLMSRTPDGATILQVVVELLVLAIVAGFIFLSVAEAKAIKKERFADADKTKPKADVTVDAVGCMEILLAVENEKKKERRVTDG